MVPRPADKDDFLRAQDVDLQLGRNFAGDDHPAVDLAREDIRANLWPLPELHHDLGAFVLALEPAENRRKHMAADRHTGADDHPAALRVFEVVDALARLELGLKDLGCPFVNHFAGLGRDSATVSPLQELHPKMPLHCLDLHAYRRLRHDQLLSGGAEAFTCYDGTKHFEMTQI